MTQEYENWFQVDHHENGGCIVLRMIDEKGHPVGVGPIEVPQDVIPPDLRRIGSRFRMRWGNLDAETADQIRENRHTVYQVTERWPDSTRSNSSD